MDEPATEKQLTAIRNKCDKFGISMRGVVKTKGEAQEAFKILDNLIAEIKISAGSGYDYPGAEKDFDVMF